MSNPKILIGDYGNIDFNEPVKMFPEQKEKFMDFLRSIFTIVDEVSTDEIREFRIGEKLFARGWSFDEYAYLLKIEDTSTVAAQLGRTWMSVDLKRGQFLPTFHVWMRSKGYDPIVDATKEKVQEFMKEKEELREKARAKRKKTAGIASKIDRMIEDRTEPCKVGDTEFYGGECKNGFHIGCKTCPRSKGYIKTEEDVKKFNEVFNELFEYD